MLENATMKKNDGNLDATPSKLIYHSIIADYDIDKAICELIDNALDIWVKNNRKDKLVVEITLDKNQQRICVIDNAGGLDRSELSYIVGPGHTGNVGLEKTIGIFGVGTKRAVVALAQDVSIKTHKDSDTFLIAFDDSWINDGADWNLPVYRVDNIPKGTTQIELIKLRRSIDDEIISKLMDHLGATYALFLENRKVSILVNSVEIDPIVFDDWAFPPNYEPRIYSGEIRTQDDKVVSVEATAGLTMESSPAGGEYGVYIYCNDRLIARALKTYDVGFATGLAGKPHAVISLARVIISLHGSAMLMPWNSSKSDINPSHEVFISLRNWLLTVVKDYTSLARRLSKFEGGWPEHVFKYAEGIMEKVHVDDFPQANTSYLPPLPVIQPRYGKSIEIINKPIVNNKPWTIGLYESIIAVDWILKQNLEQKNRISLILLDSTLEIAFKEFLVKDSGQRYPDSKLQGMFKDRSQVHNEVAKYTDIPSNQWVKINHYYDIRCQLIHRRATVNIGNTEIIDFRGIVEDVLNRLFGLQFR
jgi:hypothetical protein